MPKANLNNDKAFVKLVKIGRLTCSRQGVVRNVRTGRVINKTLKNGYVVTHAADPDTGKTRQILVHRLVYNLYKEPITDPYLEVNHKDGDTANNRISNLELVDHEDNRIHAEDVLGRVWDTSKNQAEKNSQAKFTNKRVLAIRRRFARSKCTHKELADKLDVHPVTLLGILRCTSYTSVVTPFDTACKLRLPLVGKGYKI